jgi:hypothetical protein
MKQISSLEQINGGDCSGLLSFASGAMAGWGLAGAIVGGVAASSGVGLAVAGLILAVYCG